MAAAARDPIVTIEYCGTCNYRPLAASLAMAIMAETGLASQLVHSREAGAFEIAFNGASLFSKKSSGRFPDHGEIVAAVRSRVAPPPRAIYQRLPTSPRK